MLDLEQVDHLGIRVVDGARAVAFYERLGFGVTARHDAASVIIMTHPSGIEINLIVNGVPHDSGGNVLMDQAAKYSGYTHAALRVSDVDSAARRVQELAIPITEGPVKLGNGRSFFIRDPDGNVIELRAVSDS